MSIDIIVAFAVGEKSQTDGWKKLVQLVNNDPSPFDALKNVEKEWKDTYNQPLPSSYRSNKSVALKAYKIGVSFYSDNGEVKGKSALEKDMKALAAPVHWSTSMGVHIVALNKIRDALSATDAATFDGYVSVNLMRGS